MMDSKDATTILTNTAAIRIIDLFSDQRRHILFSGSKKVKYFYDPLSDLQATILNLLNVSKKEYSG